MTSYYHTDPYWRTRTIAERKFAINYIVQRVGRWASRNSLAFALEAALGMVLVGCLG
jgi:hypothetical protein